MVAQQRRLTTTATAQCSPEEGVPRGSGQWPSTSSLSNVDAPMPADECNRVFAVCAVFAVLAHSFSWLTLTGYRTWRKSTERPLRVVCWWASSSSPESKSSRRELSFSAAEPSWADTRQLVSIFWHLCSGSGSGCPATTTTTSNVVATASTASVLPKGQSIGGIANEGIGDPIRTLVAWQRNNKISTRSH